MGTVGAPKAAKIRFATVWLGGCSGCHMSFLDMDEWLIELADLVDVVYSPIADVKEYPENVQVALVEGAIANDEHLELARKVRARTKIMISFGDCAITGNVTAMRNPFGKASSILQYVYLESPKMQGPLPDEPGIVPVLLDRVEPLHSIVPIDFYIPGCPPPAHRIRTALEQVLAAERILLDKDNLKFG